MVRALKSLQESTAKLVEDIDKWTIALVLRSQNKDGTPFRQHPLTVETVKLTWLAIDVTLRALAGPKSDELNWEVAGDIYALQNNTLKRMLFDRVGAL